MRSADTSPDPQLQQGQFTEMAFATNEEKIDHLAGDMAAKAGKVEKANESDDHVGGVSPSSGGIFTK